MTSTTRRAALGVLASVPALAIPAGAALPADSASRDAALFALIGATREAKARRLAATEAMHEAERRVPHVPAPDALIATEGDARLWSAVKVGEPIPAEVIGEHRTFRALHPRAADSRRRLARGLQENPPADELDMVIVASIRVDAAREARMDELLPADIEWRDARHQAKVDSGAWAAVERQEALLYQEMALQKEIPGTPAQTAPGALDKIALVAEYYGDPTFGGDDEQFFDWERGFRILLSAALDLKRLGTA
jgi:hypothetical protein